MPKILLPKTFVELNQPLIFLAGPIRGAPNWQDEAIGLLLAAERSITIASPRRGTTHPTHLVISGNETYFPRQRAWERHYLEYASRNGAIMFWLPGETEHNCQKAYGAMTRIELGQWMTQYRYDKNVRLCIGSDGAFSELDTIAYDLSLDAPNKRIFPTLEETCTEALRIAREPPKPF